MSKQRSVAEILASEKQKKVTTQQPIDLSTTSNTKDKSSFGSFTGTDISIDYDDAVKNGVTSLDSDNSSFQNYISSQKEKSFISSLKEAQKYLPETELQKEAQKTLDPDAYKSYKDLKSERQILIKDQNPTAQYERDMANKFLEKDRPWYHAASSILDVATAAVLNTVAAFTPETKGMTEEAAQRYNDLNLKISAVENKIIDKKKQELLPKIESLKQNIDYSKTFDFTSEDSKKHVALNKYIQTIDDMDVKLSDGSKWEWIKKFKPEDIGLGWTELASTILIEQPIKNKINNKETLTESESILAEAMALEDEYKNSGELTPNNYFTKIGSGFVDSFNFMSQMYVAGGVGKGIAKQTSIGLFKKGVVKNAAKTAGAIVGTVPRVAVMPGTYTNIIDKYNGTIESTINPNTGETEYLMREDLYNKYKGDIEIYKKSDLIRMKELNQKEIKSTADKIELEDIQYKLGLSESNPNGVLKYEDMLKAVKPNSIGTAFRKGFVGQYNEVLSETMGGKFLNKILPKVNIKNPIANNKYYNNALNYTKGVRDKIALGSIKEEYLEELFVAPLNALNDWDTKELKMLLSPEYHLEILGQVAFTGAAMRSPGFAVEGLKSFQKKPDYTELEKFKEGLKEHINEIGRSIDSPELADYIDLKTNKNLIRVNDISTKIKSLRNDGREKEALELQESLYNNLAFIAVQSGTDKEFISNLQNIRLKSDKDDVQTQAATVKTIQYVNKLKEVRDEYGHYPNYDELLFLKDVEYKGNTDLQKTVERKRTLIEELTPIIAELHKNSKYKNLDYNINDLFTKPIENVEEYDNFLKFIGSKNIDNYNKLFNLKAVEEIQKENIAYTQETFNNKISDKYQEELKNREETLSKFVEKAIEELSKEEMPTIEKVVEVIDAIKTPVSKEFKMVVKNQAIANIQEVKKEEIKQIEKVVNKDNKTKIQEEGILENPETNPEETKVVFNLLSGLATKVEKIPKTVQTNKDQSGSENDNSILSREEQIDDIERRRQEELDENAYRIPIRKTVYTGTDNYGNIRLYELIETKDGKKQVWALDDAGKRLGNISKDLSGENPDIKLLKGLLDESEGKITSYEKELSETKIEKKINVKYDIELADLENNKDVIIVEEDNLYDTSGEYSLPIEDLSEQQRNLIKDQVSSLHDFYKKQYGKSPSFSNLITHIKDNYTTAKAEEIFSAVVEGWKMNNYTPANYSQVYNDVFEDLGKLEKQAIDAIYTELQRQANIPSEEQYKANTKEVLQHIEEDQAEVITVDSNNFKIKKISGNRITNVDFKLGFNSIEYVEKKENGVFKREDKNQELKVDQDSIVDSRDLINPDLYNVGDRLYVQQAPESLWSKIIVSDDNFKYGRDVNGTYKSIPFSKWVEDNEAKDSNFRQSERFKNKVPIFTMDSNGNPKSYIHDTDWFNPFNVGNPYDKSNDVDLNNITESHQKLIDEGKKNYSNLRKDILNGTITEIEIIKKKEGPFSEIPISKPLITIAEANPDAIIGIQFDSNIEIKKKTPFENKDRIVINRAEEFSKIDDEGKYKTTGHAWALMHINTVEGVKRYRAFGVQRKNDKGEDGVLQQHIETAKHAYAAYLVLKKESKADIDANLRDMYKEHIENSKYNMSVEQANKIAEDIYKLNNIDIKDWKGIDDFIKIYLVADKKNAKPVDIFKMNKYKQHTSMIALDRDFEVVEINGTKQVNVIYPNYQIYLKNILKIDIKSFNVGTEDKPKYATSIQPVINFKPVYAEQEEKTIDVVIQEKVEEQVVISSKPIVEISDTLSEIDNMLLEEGFNVDDDFEEDLYDINNITNIENLKNIFISVGNFNIKQESDIVNYIKTLFLVELKNRETEDFSELTNNIKDKLFKYVKPKLTVINNYITSLEGLEKNKEIEKSLRKLNRAKDLINGINTNWNQFSNIAVDTLTNEQNVSIEEENDDTELNVKNYSKASFEEIGKLKISKALKRIFGDIQELDKDGIPVKGFLGLPVFMEADDVYNSVIQMLTSDITPEASYESILEILHKYETSNPWVTELISKIEKSDTQIKRQVSYNFIRHGLKMKFAMITLKGGDTNFKVYDTNRNEITRVILDQWENNFKTSPLIDDKGNINIHTVDTLLDSIKEWTKQGLTTVPISTIKGWIANFGIDLHPKLLAEIKNNELPYGNGILKYEDFLFTKKGLVYNLRQYLEYIKNSKNTNIEDEPKNNPFYDINGIVKILAKEESKYHNSSITISFRDNKKTISGVIPPSFATDRTSKLKRDIVTGGDFIENMRKISFQKHSTLLDILQNDPDFVYKFELDDIGLTAIKELGKKSPLFSSITELNSFDYDITSLVGFQDTKQGTISYKGKDGLSMRIGRMFFPTMSDKSRMLQLTTGVYNLYKESDHVFNKDMSLKEPIKDVLYKQIILPELERIVNNILKNTPSNIKDYDKAARRFNLLPALNHAKATIEGVEVPFTKYVATKDIGSLSLVEVESLYKEKLLAILEKDLKEQVEEKKKIWRDKIRTKDGLLFDKKYLSEKTFESEDRQFDVAVYDYIINMNLSYMEVFKNFVGDPAQYSQDKYFKGLDNTWEVSESDDQKISKDIGTNLGKRLALLIAPGLQIAESKNEKYYQIFLKDSVDIAENMDYILKVNYGEEEYKTASALLNNYRNTNNPSIKKAIKKQLEDAYPLVKDFLSIESTDAQEYTTLSEHLLILRRQGRVSDKQQKDIISKTIKGEKLTREDLKLVFQPIKPVYTGQIIDPFNDIVRTVYIKSSSFPLIPQLTSGTKLDSLRVKMEEIESRSGKSVRASYQTANKVGALINTIDPLSEKDLNSIEEGVNMLSLDRENFRIQQDVPFKSDLQKEDKVSMGTQIFKMLFGNGVLKEESNRKLYNEYKENFTKLINSKKQNLYKELGLDSNGEIVNKEETIKKIQELLKKEAKTRNFSKSDIASLEIVPITFKDNTTYEFKIPLWLHTNGNKFESLLNSITTNRIMSLKLPGNSFVVGSENGFSFKDNLEGIDENDIIWTKKYNGVELQGAKEVDGKMQLPQILAPSKFKDSNGKLINLLKKDKNGLYLYFTEDENGRKILRNGMFDPELLKNFGFRTPTSSHVSGSAVEIVGFLPVEVGDLMIVPKSFTKQKGMDYDVDKESAYQYHHILLPSGKIEKLKEEHRERGIAYIRNLKGQSSSIEDQVYLENILGEEYQDFIEDIAQATEEKIINFNRKFDEKLYENTFIEQHISVYENTSKEIQKNINSVLSMDFAREQKQLISDLKDNKESKGFNILSPEYQKEKMALGAVGKLAIGVYSNNVTFHSLANIAAEENNPVEMKKVFEDEEGNVLVEKYQVSLGGFKSNGIFGKKMTLDGDREIAKAFEERQNTATDNEKEGILGIVGINKHTIGVDSLLAALGFDKSKDKKWSIPYLFLSQPIIQEFTKRLDDGTGVSTKYDANLEQTILKDLAKNYNIDLTTFEFNPKDFSIDVLLNGIKGDKAYQFAMLQYFIELKDMAKQLSSKQSIINANNLTKSMIESIDLFDRLVNFKTLSFKNLEKLIGDFTTEEKEGYIQVEEDLFIKPLTPQGEIVVNGLVTNNKLWQEYFPYSDPHIKSLFKEVDDIGSNEVSDSKRILAKQEIMKEFKKYINSKSSNGLFNQRARDERNGLFFDRNGNTSIAKYLKSIVESTENSDGINSVKTNKLINKFSYDINKDNTPSLVMYNNTASDSFNEEYLYRALAELMIKEEKLPSRNGKEYNTRILAQELINYAYLEGGVQEAVQFVKYVPIQYLDSVSVNGKTVTENLRSINSPQRDKLIGRANGDKYIPSLFFKQFIQHFPEKARQYTKEEIKKYGIYGDTFTIKSIERPSFISKRKSTKDKNKSKKWDLYTHTGNGVYIRIDVLGTHGMSEYQFNNTNAVSSMNEEILPVVKIASLQNENSIPKVVQTPFGIENNGNIDDILDKISKQDLEGASFLSKTAEILKPFTNGSTTVKIINEGNVRTYNKNRNEITISNKELEKNPAEVARFFLHELIHSITVNEIDKYITRNENGTYNIKENAPKSVSDLLLSYNLYRKSLDQDALNTLEKKILAYRTDKTIGFNEKEALELYPAVNIYEFMTGALTSPLFMKKASEIKIGNSTLADKIWKAITDLLVSLSNIVEKNTLAEQAILQTLQFIQEENTKTQNNNLDVSNNIEDIYNKSILPVKINKIENQIFNDIFNSLEKKDC